MALTTALKQKQQQRMPIPITPAAVHPAIAKPSRVLYESWRLSSVPLYSIWGILPLETEIVGGKAWARRARVKSAKSKESGRIFSVFIAVRLASILR